MILRASLMKQYTSNSAMSFMKRPNFMHAVITSKFVEVPNANSKNSFVTISALPSVIATGNNLAPDATLDKAR